MTQDMTDRERKLLEAAKAYFSYTHSSIANPAQPSEESMLMMLDALRAYDPPRKEYTMPPWEEFKRGRDFMHDYLPTSVAVGGMWVSENIYNAIREAIAKEMKDT